MKFPEEQKFEKHKDCVLQKIKVTARVKLQPGNEMWVEVSTAEEGSISVEPYHPLYIILLCLAWEGTADVEWGQLFHIIVAYFG